MMVGGSARLSAGIHLHQRNIRVPKVTSHASAMDQNLSKASTATIATTTTGILLSPCHASAETKHLLFGTLCGSKRMLTSDYLGGIS